MFHRIVHANDGTEGSLAALRLAIDLAVLTNASLDVLFVEEIVARSGLIADIANYDAAERRRIAKRQRLAETMAEHAGVTISPHVFAGHPVERIVQFTFESGADLLVIGATEHTDLCERMFGRRSDRMTHKVGCSVLIVREGEATW